MSRNAPGGASFLLIVLAGPVLAAPPSLPPATRQAAESVREMAMAGTGAFDIVRSLTTEVGPRLAGSDGDRRAVEWGLRTMRELGLENVRAEPVEVPHWVRGTADAEIVAPFPQPLVACALGGSVATPPEGLEAEVLRLGSLDELDRLPLDGAKGKIVFLDRRMHRSPDGRGYGATVSIRSRGASHAARKGAVAVVIRSVGSDSNRLPHTGGMRYEDGVARIPAAALSGPDADLLAGECASGRPVRLRLRLDPRDLGTAMSANVVGEIRGSTRPEEIVLVGGHLDSWDLGTGAIDDAAGCAVALTVAKLAAALPRRPERTIRVVLFANEEFGLSGGSAYAKLHAAELAKHVVCLESDLGSGCVRQLSGGVGEQAVPFLADLASLLAPLGIEWDGRNDGWGGVDVSPLREAGVPEIPLHQDASVYFDHHHSANDTLDKVEPLELDQVVAAFATAAIAVADRSVDLGRGDAVSE